MRSRIRWSARAARPALAAISLVLAGGALAQEEPTPRSQGIEEVIVTSQRIAQSLQDVPVAVSAFDAEMLEQQQITRLEDIRFSVPSIAMAPNTGASSAAKIFLRGLGEDESFFTADVPVGIYVDEVYIARQTGALFDLYDVDRIEVLRGPQGTLFGRNTTAGAIQLISKRPDADAFGLDADLTVGDFERRDARATLNVPIVDGRLAARFSGMVRTREGWSRERNGDRDVNDQDVWGGRASLRWQPGEATDLLFNFDYLKEDNSAGYALGVQFNGVDEYPDFSRDLDGDGDPFTLQSDLQDPLSLLESWGASINLSHRFGDYTFKSITAYRELRNELNIDFDGFDATGPNFFSDVLPPELTLPAIFHVFQDQDEYQVSQELQLQGSLWDERIDFIAGVFLFRENNEQITENGLGAPLGSPFNTPTFSELTTESYAAFANFIWKMSDQARLTVGGRYTEESKDFFHQVRTADGSVLIATDPRVAGQPVQVRLEPDFSKFTPRVAFDYRFNDNVLAYASFANGFKAGSFDGRRFLDQFGVINMEVIPPEDVSAYELGLKSDLLDDRLRVNVAGFFTDVEDLQGSGVVNNQLARTSVGDAEIQGAEIELTAVPLAGLELTAMASFMDTEVTSLNFNLAEGCAAEVAAGLTEEGVKLKEAPELTWRLGASYAFPLGGLAGELRLGADVNHKDAYPTLNCTSRASSVVEHTVVNAQAAYYSDSGRYRVVLSGNNLTDEEYNNGQPVLNLLPTYTFSYMSPPRHWTLMVAVSF
ncbi:MAG TPA: TonB-dependent receptor [Steroidobacteraceae bacterium]|nr:TonB-dependent receptor [Steroidobacteraceae bacterium]